MRSATTVLFLTLAACAPTLAIYDTADHEAFSEQTEDLGTWTAIAHACNYRFTQPPHVPLMRAARRAGASWHDWRHSRDIHALRHLYWSTYRATRKSLEGRLPNCDAVSSYARRNPYMTIAGQRPPPSFPKPAPPPLPAPAPSPPAVAAPLPNAPASPRAAELPPAAPPTTKASFSLPDTHTTPTNEVARPVPQRSKPPPPTSTLEYVRELLGW